METLRTFTVGVLYGLLLARVATQEPLPQLAIDTYPPAARDQSGRVRKRRPTSTMRQGSAHSHACCRPVALGDARQPIAPGSRHRTTTAAQRGETADVA